MAWDIQLTRTVEDFHVMSDVNSNNAPATSVTLTEHKADEFDTKKKMLHDTCKGQTGIDEGLIVRAQKGDFDDDPKLKDYLKCAFFQLSMMNEAGDIDVDAMRTLLPDSIKDLGEKVIADCTGVGGADAGEKALNFNKCFFKSQPSIFFVI